MGTVVRHILRGFLCIVMVSMALQAMADTPKLGIVIMHGKGGSPAKYVTDLASALEEKGYLVANLDMPWSAKRDYDADVMAAESQVEEALATLRAQGAQKVFVAGHSQGGAFAIHLAGTHAMDGVICIAPGGSVASNIFKEKLAGSVARARQLVAEGKGDEKTRLEDFEGSKGRYPIITTPAIYLSWFSPEGAMNIKRAVNAANPGIPVLWIVAERDYPGLRKFNIPLFDSLSRTPHTKLYEPASDHLGAPTASIDEIVRWTREVAGGAR